MSDGLEEAGVSRDRRSRLKDAMEYVRERRAVQLAIVVGIPAAVLVVFFLVPLLSMLWLSFQDSLPPGSQFTLANYVRAFEPVYATVLWRTTVLTVQTTVVVTVLGYALAYSSVRFSKRTTLILLLVILPYWTNYIIRMYAWITILQNGGVLSSVLQLFELVPGKVGYLYTPQAVLVGFSYIWLPLATLPFYASLANMDEDLIEAAKDLGSGPIKTFFTVTLPTTIDGVIAGIILVAIPTFGSFITPALLGGSNVLMIGMVIESQFNEAFNWPFGSTLGVLVSLLVVVVMLAAVRSGAGGRLFGASESGGEGE
jgi:spermidine/putrescine transport system permease protein